MPVCCVAGCVNVSHTSRMCVKHYHADRRARAPRCRIVECPGPGTEGDGLCPKHWARMKRHGDVTVRLDGGKRRGYGKGYRDLGGYEIRADAVVHPVAMKGGVVRVNRKVLYDKIGPGAHPCHWCGRPVSWELSYPKDSGALVSDHLDGDKANNDPSNLMPACGSCNLLRGFPWWKVRHGVCLT